MMKINKNNIGLSIVIYVVLSFGGMVNAADVPGSCLGNFKDWTNQLQDLYIFLETHNPKVVSGDFSGVDIAKKIKLLSTDTCKDHFAKNDALNNIVDKLQSEQFDKKLDTAPSSLRTYDQDTFKELEWRIRVINNMVEIDPYNPKLPEKMKTLSDRLADAIQHASDNINAIMSQK